MAWAFDAKSVKVLNDVGSPTTAAWSHTVAAGNDRILIVVVSLNPGNPATRNVSGITYGTQTLTVVTSGTVENTSVAASPCRVEMWYLIAPNVGTNTITVTFNTGTVTARCVASSWTGINQAGGASTFGTAVTATGSDNAPTVDASSASGELVIDGVTQNPDTTDPTGALTVGSGQTEIEILDSDYSQSVDGFFCASSYETGAGTVTMSWSSDSTATNHIWAIVAVPLKPSTTTSPDVSASATITELGVSVLRRGPVGVDFDNRTSLTNVAHQVAHWEASGAYPYVLRARRVNVGDQSGWAYDTIYTPDTISPAGAMAITALPTAFSDRSLVVTSQNKLYQYPLTIGDPTTVEMPELENGSTGLPPMVYFSRWDVPGWYTLDAVLVKCRYMVKGTDHVGASYAFGDYGPWAPVQWKTGNNLVFQWPKVAGKGLVGGTGYRLMLVIYDAAATELAAPRLVDVESILLPAEEPAEDLSSVTPERQS